MRRRNKFYQTGLPGFIRFGYSPGWVGRSPSGMGPCAQFLATGQWPSGQIPAGPAAGAPVCTGGDPQTRLEFLKNQAKLLEQQLEAVKAQIDSMQEEQS